MERGENLELNIRLAHSGDEDTVAGLNSPVQEYHFKHDQKHFKPFNAAEAAQFFRILLESDTAKIWFAERGGEPVGYVLAIVHQSPENPFCRQRRWMEIDQIGVNLEFRGMGCGKALMDTAVEFARSEGIRDIELSSWSFNTAAHESFRRMGFVPKLVRFKLDDI